MGEKFDNVENPYHYNQYEHEVIELTENLGFCLGNAVKYILRAPYKGKYVEDLEKAKWYINRLRLCQDLHCEVSVAEESYDELIKLTRSFKSRLVLDLMVAVIGDTSNEECDMAADVREAVLDGFVERIDEMVAKHKAYEASTEKKFEENCKRAKASQDDDYFYAKTRIYFGVF